MELYCVEVVLQCLHPQENNTFYRGLFKQEVREMSSDQFNQFCKEVNQLEDYYAYTVGRWHTDCLYAFSNLYDDFYRINFPVEAALVPYAHRWQFIQMAEEMPGHFSREVFLMAFDQVGDEEAYRFFNNVLQLNQRMTYAVNCYYIDTPFAVKNISGAPLEKVLVQFDPIDRNQALPFRMKLGPSRRRK